MVKDDIHLYYIYVTMKEMDWSQDSEPIREYVALATGEGFRPGSIDQGRSILIRYSMFLRDIFHLDLRTSGWQEFAAYKSHLGLQGISKTTARGYLSYIAGYYRLRAQATQEPRLLDLYTKMRAIGMPRRAKSEKWKPFAPELLTRILEAAKSYSTISQDFHTVPSEDYVFLMTLLYSGGRAQFYGLRTREIDFDRMEISAIVKGGKRATIPLHPKLAEILRTHLATRNYASEFVFRQGRDPTARTGQKANRQNAWRACKRAQQAAGLSESVHPHRFRKTLASLGKRLGMDPQFLQAILAHESVTMTLDQYSEVELDDVKREFAKLDFCAKEEMPPSGSSRDLIHSLKLCAPRGKEHAWNIILEGLLSLLGGD
jgi:integrase